MFKKFCSWFNIFSSEELIFKEKNGFSIEDLSLIDVSISKNEYGIPIFIKYSFQYKSILIIAGEIISFVPDFAYGSVFWLQVPNEETTYQAKNFFYEHLINQLHLAKLNFPSNIINEPRILLEALETEKLYHFRRLKLI